VPENLLDCTPRGSRLPILTGGAEGKFSGNLKMKFGSGGMPARWQAIGRMDSPSKTTPFPDDSRVVGATIVALCLLGVFLRAYFYCVNRSLWFDEAMLACNIVSRSFLGLLKHLDYDQIAPVGFLLLEKAGAVLFGSGDLALRLVPFLAGIASVPLMYAAAKRYGTGAAPLVALALFSCSPDLVYFSSELKQYSTDVLVALLLLCALPGCLSGPSKARAIAVMGVTCIIGCWVSHPAVFVVAGLFGSIGLALIVQKDVGHLKWLAGAVAAWVVCLFPMYLLSTRYLESTTMATDFWRAAFAPLPPWSNIRWYYNALRAMLKNPVGVPVDVVLETIIVAGMVSYALRRWQLMTALAIPFLAALSASALGKYPFSGRLLLFTTPLVYLLVAEGIEKVRTVAWSISRPVSVLVMALAGAYLLYDPALIVWHNLQSPPMGEDVKAVMNHLKKGGEGDDLTYVYYGAVPAFQFYSHQFGFKKSAYRLGTESRSDTSGYFQDLNGLRGHSRVWVIFSHVYIAGSLNEEDFFVRHLSKMGRKTEEFRANRATIYLYDLSPRS
jgi:hypothetical protein